MWGSQTPRLPVEMDLIWSGTLMTNERNKQSMKIIKVALSEQPHGTKNTSPSESHMDLDGLTTQRLQTSGFILDLEFGIIATANRITKKVLPQASKHRTSPRDHGRAPPTRGALPAGTKGGPTAPGFRMPFFPSPPVDCFTQIAPDFSAPSSRRLGRGPQTQSFAQIPHLPRNPVPQERSG